MKSSRTAIARFAALASAAQAFSLRPSRGDFDNMTAQVIARTVAFALASAAISCGAPAWAAETPLAEAPLLQIKPDAVSGKIIATLPRPDADGVSGRYIYLTQLE